MTQRIRIIHLNDGKTHLCQKVEFATPSDLRQFLSLPLTPTDAAPLMPIEAKIQAQRLRVLPLNEVRDRIRRRLPWFIAGSILTLNLMLHVPTFVIGSLITGMTIRILKAIIHSNSICRTVWQWLLKKAHLSESQIPWMAAGFAGGAWLSLEMPASAAFFVQAEEYLKKILAVGQASGVNTLVPLLFGTLRVIFIIYIGIALVRVINSFRNDEDWVTAARIPLIVVLCIVIGDALSTLIVQGAG